MLVFAIIIDKNDPTTNVAFCSNVAISNVSKMCHFCVYANVAVFYFHKIANATISLYHTSCMYMCPWTYCCILLYCCVANNAFLYHNIVAKCAIRKGISITDNNIFSNHTFPTKNIVAINCCPLSDNCLARYINTVSAFENNTIVNMFFYYLKSVLFHITQNIHSYPL